MVELDRDCGRLQHIDAECAKDAPKRHHCRKSQIDKYDDRPQVASPDPHQRSVGATGCERHADPEAQASDYIGKPGETVAGIDGFGQIQITEIRQHVGADHRHCHGEQPGAHAPPMPHVDDIGNGTHGAKVGLVGDETEHDTQAKSPPDDRLDQNRCVHKSLPRNVIEKVQTYNFMFAALIYFSALG